MTHLVARISVVTAVCWLGACGTETQGIDFPADPGGLDVEQQIAKGRGGPGLDPAADSAGAPGGVDGDTGIGGSGGIDMAGGSGGGGAPGTSTGNPTEPGETGGNGPDSSTLVAKIIKTKLLIADIIYVKQIKLGVARIGEMNESKEEKRYQRANGSADVERSTVRAGVVYAEDIEADEVQAKQLFAEKIQFL
ncbi:MAG: hypothetical protein SGI86_19985 [Deltaproteobacteria bacterium]|nr:hypothetical protein [Deltaproteobacteria bacterium]